MEENPLHIPPPPPPAPQPAVKPILLARMHTTWAYYVFILIYFSISSYDLYLKIMNAIYGGLPYEVPESIIALVCFVFAIPPFISKYRAVFLLASIVAISRPIGFMIYAIVTNDSDWVFLKLFLIFESIICGLLLIPLFFAWRDDIRHRRQLLLEADIQDPRHIVETGNAIQNVSLKGALLVERKD